MGDYKPLLDDDDEELDVPTEVSEPPAPTLVSKNQPHHGQSTIPKAVKPAACPQHTPPRNPPTSTGSEEANLQPRNVFDDIFGVPAAVGQTAPGPLETSARQSTNDFMDDLFRTSAPQSGGPPLPPTTSPIREDWECPQCTYRNKSGTTKCEICEAPRTERPRGSSLSPGNHTPPQRGGTWVCKECHCKTNPHEATTCSVCGHTRPEERTPLAAPPGKYYCTQCTLENSVESLRCAACDFPQPNRISRSLMDQGGGAVESDRKGWECSMCTFINPIDSPGMACSMCGSQRQ